MDWMMVHECLGCGGVVIPSEHRVGSKLSYHLKECPYCGLRTSRDIWYVPFYAPRHILVTYGEEAE